MTQLSEHTDIDSIIKSILPELIEIRHDIHSHPELGYKENTRRDE